MVELKGRGVDTRVTWHATAKNLLGMKMRREGTGWEGFLGVHIMEKWRTLQTR